jgi:hypothetical protein
MNRVVQAGRKALDSYRFHKTIKEATKEKGKRKTTRTIDEGLSLLERLTGRRRSELNVRPRVTVNPKVTVYVNDKRQEDVKVEVEDEGDEESERGVNPLACYRVEREPFYISLNGEKELFARAAGIRPYSITVDRHAEDYLTNLFGKSSYCVCTDPSELPKKAARLYKEVAFK